MVNAPPIRRTIEHRGAAYRLRQELEGLQGSDSVLEYLLEGPRGCVAGETELWNPHQQRGYRIDELCRNGIRPWVETLRGPVLAEVPFRKGFAPLYRVETDGGASCLVAGDHRFLCREGWVRTDSLSPGMELLIAHGAGAHRSLRTAPDSQAGYRRARRSDDGRLRGASAVYRVGVPSPVGVLEPVRAGWHRDGQASTAGRSRPCRADDLRATTHSARQMFDGLGPLPIPDGEWRAFVGIAGSIDASVCLPLRQSHAEMLPAEPSGRRDRGVSCTRHNFACPCDEYRPAWDRIKSIRYERDDHFYDLTVPGEGHYLADGMWSKNTGKSHSLAYLLWKLCQTRKLVRILVIRTARSLLTDTFCKTFEEDVCPGHECIGGGNRVNRHEYLFGHTGSRIVLGGLDDQNRYYGSDWDVIVLEEAVQFAWKDVEPFLGALRNNKLGWHALIYATNPDAPGHWLNKRANDGLCKRFVCVHQDNPSLWDIERNDWHPKGKQFMGTLSRYTGVAYDRHVRGLWRGAEGQVWETYDERRHVVPTTPDGIIEYRGSIDWGFADTGVLAVWGITVEKKTCLVALWYMKERNLEWWAEKLVQANREFGMTRVVADPSRNDAIDLCNDWLVKAGAHRMVFGADNRRASSQRGDLGGLDLVRWGFQTGRIVIYDGCVRESNSDDYDKPWHEVPAYVWLRDARGEIVPDRTDPKCVDHLCDGIRYHAADLWPRVVEASVPPLETYGRDPYWSRVGTPEILLRNRLRRERLEDEDA